MTPSDVVAIVAIVVSAIVSIVSAYISYQNNKANIAAKRAEIAFERQLEAFREVVEAIGQIRAFILEKIVQGFFCNFDQVLPRNLFLRSTRTFKCYICSAGQPFLTDLVQDRRDQT